MAKQTWIRDSLHDLRKFAQKEGLEAADDALRVAIIRVSYEQGIPTNLPVRDLALGAEHQVPLKENRVKE